MGSQRPGDYFAHRVVIEITKTFDLMDDVFSSHFARYGLTYVKFNALVQIMYAGEEGLTLSALGEKMLVSRPNITSLVDRMERDGLVHREADQKDRRVTRVRLSDRAKRLLATVLPIHAGFTASVVSGLNLHEKEQLINLLQKLQQSIEKR